jgi:hypothetical protein
MDLLWVLSWDSSPTNDRLILRVLQLDGHAVAMKFNFKDKVGQLLSNEKHRWCFRLKYGIELNPSKDGSGSGSMGNNKRRLVDIGPNCNLLIYITCNINKRRNEMIIFEKKLNTIGISASPTRNASCFILSQKSQSFHNWFSHFFWYTFVRMVGMQQFMTLPSYSNNGDVSWQIQVLALTIVISELIMFGVCCMYMQLDICCKISTKRTSTALNKYKIIKM